MISTELTPTTLQYLDTGDEAILNVTTKKHALGNTIMLVSVNLTTNKAIISKPDGTDEEIVPRSTSVSVDKNGNHDNHFMHDDEAVH